MKCFVTIILEYVLRIQGSTNVISKKKKFSVHFTNMIPPQRAYRILFYCVGYVYVSIALNYYNDKNTNFLVPRISISLP